jgi:polysaccharide export outer membrane protein
MPILGSTNTHSLKPRTNLRPMWAILLLGVFLSLSVFCQGQAQTPPLVPLSQGSGSAPSKLATGSNEAGSAGNMGGLTNEPIYSGETVHITVFDAPDFSSIAQVSENGDVPVSFVGQVHLAGLDSVEAQRLITNQLMRLNLVNDPHVAVTVDSLSTEITVLGEVHQPGIYPPAAKRLLSDLIAAAGGMTGNTGRVVEISNDRTPGKQIEIPWDPTMHNTDNYNYPIHPGDRVFVKACGIAYVGGHVTKPGAYSLCGSPTMTLSELIAMAGGVSQFTTEKHTILIRTQPDGTRVSTQIDLHRILMGKAADPTVREDDIIYVTPSPLKFALNQATAYAMTLASPLIYVFH